MKLYAQQGYGTGDDGDKIVEGLRREFIHGAILSPKDYGIERVKALLSAMTTDHPEAERLFDPQFYACLIANDPEARMGRLLAEDYPYFSTKRRNQLESEVSVQSSLTACLEFQAGLDVSAVISPNIVIRRSLDSIDALIAKNFIRSARAVWGIVGDGRPLYATLAVDAEALQDRQELESFLADITLLEEPPDGFYVLVNNTTSSIQPELVDFRTLGGWMLLNHALNLNGFEVINGFSDILTPFVCAAGGSAGATGWWANLKVFSMDRFEPSVPGGRRPIPRYLSKALLNSIRFDELQRLRGFFPQVINDLASDDLYDESNGSQPEDQRAEVLQTWDAISSFGSKNSHPEISECLEWLNTSEQLYDSINTTPAMRLSGRSNNAHLESLRGGVNLFAQLAEINL